MKQHIYSIAPHAPFLPTLVEAVLHGPLLEGWSKTNAFWLSDVTIILPTRRARLQLSEAFAFAMGGASLLPDIRTLGGGEGDDNLFLSRSAHAEILDSVPEVDRRFMLGGLIEKWLENSAQLVAKGTEAIHTNPARVLALADSLAQLVDDMNIEGIAAQAIRNVPSLDLNPERQQDLALNFQQNLEFLEIILSTWPEILKQRGQIDVSHLKNLRVEQEIEELKALYGERPVIVAGSTGSVPSTAKLLKAIADLPHGCIVLPGLDTTLSQDTQTDLLTTSLSPHGHPQYGMAHLLKSLGKTADRVQELGGKSSTIRTQIVRNALTLARDTTLWSKSRSRFSKTDMHEAIDGIAISATKTEQEQALVVALAARDALENKQSVGIITPDRNFARRIAVELKRFEINVDDSAGTPLFQSRTGRLVRQILNVGLTHFAPVDLMGLLRNRYVFPDMQHSELLAVTDHIEFALLRGQRPQAGISGLRSVLKQNLDGTLPHVTLRLDAFQGQAIAILLSRLEDDFAPLVTLLKKPGFTAAEISQALSTVLDKVCGHGVSQPNILIPGYEELKVWVTGLAQSSFSGPSLNVATIQTALPALMAKVSIRSGGHGRSDIAIWGRLEARLQSADLMILCTLNEGIWPEIADPGPWMSRSMRLHAGLEPPERQQGLAAHDFEMAIGNKDVLLTYAKRLGTSPALPSRLVERLCTFIDDDGSNEMHQRGEKWIKLARSLDSEKIVVSATRPAPCPSANLRPKSISITEVETLIRSPYDLYAKYVLGLRAIDPLGQDMGFRERGTLVHEVFARFVQLGHDPTEEDAFSKLMGIARNVFSVLEYQPGRRDIWLRRLEKSAIGFIEFERARSEQISQRFAEIDLQWSTPPGVKKLKLRGRADRIDLRIDGHIEILDFKTGSIPDKKEMQTYLAPQLLTEAAIIAQNGFENVLAAPVEALTYIKIGADPAAFTKLDFALPTGLNISEAAVEMLNMVQARADAFLHSDESVMSPRIMPKAGQSYAGDYDHLARTDEWSQVDGGEES